MLQDTLAIYKLKRNKLMTREENKKIIDFCKTNLHTHTDWTGTYVETEYKCDSVDEFINKLLNYINNN